MGTKLQSGTEDLYQALFEEITDGIFISDTRGRFLEVNRQGCELLGYSREELVQLSWQEVLPVENGRQGLPDLEEGSEGQTVRIEGQVRDKEGRLFTAEIKVRRLADGRLVAFVRGINEHKRTEGVQHIYELLASQSRDIILVVRYNDGRILEANVAAVNSYGYSREELLALTIHDLRALETQTATAAQMAQANARGLLFETVHRRKDGSTFPVEVSSQGAISDGKRILISVIRDISERKQIEEAVREREEQYRLLFTEMLSAFALHEIITNEAGQPIDYRFISVNAAFEEMTGLPAKDIIGKTVREVIPGIEPSWIERYGRVALTGSSIQFEDYVHDIKKYFEVRAYCPKQGQFAVIFQDITERKRTEAEIEGLAKFPDENPNPVMRISHSGSLLYANQASRDLLESWNSTLSQPIPDYWINLIREALETGLSTENEVASGTRVFSLVFTPIVADDYVNIYGYDITERKQAEAARQVSEARLAGIIASAMDAIISLDEEQRIVLFNAAAEKIFGYAASEMLGQPLDRLMPERFHEVHREQIHDFGQSGTGTRAMGRSRDIIGRRANGEEFPLEASISQIEVAGAKLYTVIHRDITQRKRAEEELRDSEASLKFSQQVAHVGHWVWDTSTNKVTWSDEMYCIFGLNPDNFTGDLSNIIMETIHPDDREKVIQSNNRVLTEQKPAPLEYRVIWPDQSVRTVWAIPGGNVVDANGKILKLMGIVQDITERKRAEETLREMADNMAAAQWIAHFGSWQIGLNDELEFVEPQMWSDECYRIFGIEPGSVEITKELFYSRIHPDDREAALQALVKAIQERTGCSYEYRLIWPDGSIRYIHDQANVVLDERTGQPVKVVGTAHDITERKQAEEAQAKLEEQLRQAHKMESVGRLAGGIAHDFNNLLTVIRGYCDLMQPHLPNGNPLLKDLEQIRRAAERAAALTRQLLAFSRKQMLAPTTLDLNDLMTNLHKMLGRLIGEDINLVLVLQPGLWTVKADPGQIEQVIINLAANARDAMPIGGMLTIETRNVHLDDSYLKTHPEAPTGSCVMLAVTDTGHGIDASSRAHVFEPFFTTKEVGQGTGLGLATAYGIIKQSGGDILVYSEVGHGTTFKIYLPASETVPDVVVPRTPPVSHAGTETILLVEDEEEVRNLVGRTLQGAGYTVLEARHGGEALSLAGQYQEPIDLLLTDVIMPQMSGRELAEQLTVFRPRMKVLFISGYTDDAVVRHGVLAAEVEYLSKPFSPSLLVSKVRQVLDK
ncbi:MAG: PAS domain S-box protein [Anaerolineae bacterium]|nr:PAS domain S-box protein [Anaerolineae bacterium]